MSLPCPCADLRSVAFSPDGQYLAAAGRCGTVRVWNARTWQHVIDMQSHSRRIRALAFSPDGARLASAGDDTHIRIRNTHTGAEELALPSRPGRVLAMVFVGNGRLATGGSDNAIHLWDLSKQTVESRLVGHTGSVAALACDRTGHWLVSGSYDTTVRLWDLRPKESDETAQRPGDPGVR